MNGEFLSYDAGVVASGFTLEGLSGLPINGSIHLDLPPFVDENDNGWHDLFDCSLSVSGQSPGSYETDVSGGTVTATWNRAKDSKTGVCTLRLVDDIYGQLGDFSHSFEVQEFIGSLYYTPGLTNVVGRLALLQSGVAGSQMVGPIRFQKTKGNPNDLLLLQGVWTNNPLGALVYSNASVIREIEWPTNYYSFLDLRDGDPSTPEEDYYWWTLSIDDLNDSNTNGIPDLGDDPQAAAPRLSLSLSGSSLKLNIEAEPGRTYRLQEAAALTTTPQWQNTQDFTLTNTPQLLMLPPPGTNRFWRVQAL